MIPREIFTSFAEFQGIVSVNDFWFPLGFQELLQAPLCFLKSFCFARILHFAPFLSTLFESYALNPILLFTSFLSKLHVFCCF